MFGGLAKDDKKLLLEIKENVELIKAQMTTSLLMEKEILNILQAQKNPAVSLKFTLGTEI